MGDENLQPPPNSVSGPCGNKDCDRCYPLPRWKISEHRIQHLTYTRKIKAASAEEAMRIFEAGTAWPSSYDDDYGEVVQQDEPVVELLPPDDYHLTECCYDLSDRLERFEALEMNKADRAVDARDGQPLTSERLNSPAAGDIEVRAEIDSKYLKLIDRLRSTSNGDDFSSGQLSSEVASPTDCGLTVSQTEPPEVGAAREGLCTDQQLCEKSVPH